MEGEVEDLDEFMCRGGGAPYEYVTVVRGGGENGAEFGMGLEIVSTDGGKGIEGGLEVKYP